jgi:hypothetical protein
MTKEKNILDIRYFSDDEKSANGQYISIFKIEKEASALGSRIARKLRELGFSTGEFDHVYINFTERLPNSEVVLSNKHCEKWFKCFDVGINRNEANQLSDSDKLLFIEEKTYQVLELINQDQTMLIEDVKDEIASKGSEIELLHKYKETKSYEVKLTYQIRPNGLDNSVAKIYYRDKKTGKGFISEIELELYEDILFLASNISVSKDLITLKPRASFKAEIYNKRYDVPISIQIA